MNKLLKEYLDFIKEAPIEDISHIGNPNTATNFTKPEIKMLQTKKYENRLRNAFKNTPFVFDIVFDYHKDFDASFDDDNYNTGAFIPDNKIIDVYRQDRYSDLIKGKPGVITFISQGNLSPSNRIPMTPWILAHKIAHAIDDNTKYKNFIVSNKLSNILMNYNRDHNTMSHEHNVFDSIFSFKSWKNNRDQLFRLKEIDTELVTLYLIKGKIEPNKTGDKEFDNQISLYCLKFNNILNEIFKSLEGKILTEV
jgi:hypothetical protein